MLPALAQGRGRSNGKPRSRISDNPPQLSQHQLVNFRTMKLRIALVAFLAGSFGHFGGAATVGAVGFSQASEIRKETASETDWRTRPFFHGPLSKRGRSDAMNVEYWGLEENDADARAKQSSRAEDERLLAQSTSKER